MRKNLSSYWIRSALFTFLQKFSVTLFGLVNFIILIRSLSKPEMGVWAFFLVVTTLFETAKTSLLKNAHIKFVGNNPNEKTAIASSSMLLNIAVSVLFVIFLILGSGVLSSWLGGGFELERMLKWFIPGIFFLVLFSHFEAIAQSHLDFKSVFAGHFSRQILFFLCILIHAILKMPFNLVQVVIYQSLSIAFGSSILFYFSKKHLLHVFNPSLKWVQKLMGFGGYVFGIAVTSNIFANLDQILIGKFTSSKSMVANYNAATRISNMVDIPSYSAAEIMLPKVTQVDLSKGYQQVTYIYERMVAILLCFTTPIAVVIFFFPKLVISLIAGAQYLDSAFILQMYMLSALVKPIQNQAANIFLYIGKARLCFFLNVFFLGVNSGLNYICFVQFGPYGAAVGNVVASFLATVVWYRILQKSINVNHYNIVKYAVETYKTVYSKIVMFRRLKQAKMF